MRLSLLTLRRTHSAFFFLAIIAYFALVSVLSHMPGTLLTAIPWNIWDKAMHFLEYLPLGFFVAVGMRHRPLSYRKVTVCILGILLAFGFGCLDELHQSFVPGRFATFSDVLADTLGGGVGVLIGLLPFFTRPGDYPVGVSNHLTNSIPPER